MEEPNDYFWIHCDYHYSNSISSSINALIISTTLFTITSLTFLSPISSFRNSSYQFIFFSVINFIFVVDAFPISFSLFITCSIAEFILSIEVVHFFSRSTLFSIIWLLHNYCYLFLMYYQICLLILKYRHYHCLRLQTQTFLSNCLCHLLHPLNQNPQMDSHPNSIFILYQVDLIPSSLTLYQAIHYNCQWYCSLTLLDTAFFPND